jgi:hypothetical protein
VSTKNLSLVNKLYCGIIASKKSRIELDKNKGINHKKNSEVKRYKGKKWTQ